MPGAYSGPCKRGVFALSSWDVPLKRPQCWLEEKTGWTIQLPDNKILDWSKFKEVADNKNANYKQRQKLMVKYGYNANHNSPLGKELTVKQKDQVYYVSQHDVHWIQVMNEAGDQGYVPASYVMPVQDQVTSLPWLDQKIQDENVKQETAQYKPYKSAYAPKERDTGSGGQEDLTEFYCKVCDKQLNGPIPYKVHLNSKAHKEELEVAQML